jgi:hypothetical protein
LTLKDPNEIAMNTVIGLLVKDPRLLMPKKKSFNKCQQQHGKLNYFSPNQLITGMFK